MRVITIKNIAIQFDADQITFGDPKVQANRAIGLLNGMLQREPYGFAAQVLVGDNSLKVEVDEID